MTEIYVFDREGSVLPEESAALLPPWRDRRLAKLKIPAVLQESLAAGLLCAYALGRRGVPRSAAVTLLPMGKPVLAGREDVFFSLSHSGRYILCAVGDGPVGADVQEPRSVRPSIARRFHPDEQDWLVSQPDWEAAFFRLWARKEAWVKAMSDERMLSLSEADVIHPRPGLWFYEDTLSGGCALAVCSREPDFADVTWVTAAALLAAQV